MITRLDIFDSFTFSKALATVLIPLLWGICMNNDFTSIVTRIVLFVISRICSILLMKSVLSFMCDLILFTIGSRWISTNSEILDECELMELTMGRPRVVHFVHLNISLEFLDCFATESYQVVR